MVSFLFASVQLVLVPFRVSVATDLCISNFLTIRVLHPHVQQYTPDVRSFLDSKIPLSLYQIGIRIRLGNVENIPKSRSMYDDDGGGGYGETKNVQTLNGAAGNNFCFKE